ncbi:hypothetical protein [Planctomycetes bacterium Pla163]
MAPRRTHPLPERADRLAPSPPRRRRAGRTVFGAWTLLVAATLCACSSGRTTRPAGDGFRIENTSASPIDPNFEAAFESLMAALAADDTEVARRLVTNILARQPTGDTLDLALRYAAVLDGRAVMEACTFELEVGIDPDDTTASQLRLVVTTVLRAPARLELPPISITRTLSTLDPVGAERTRTDTLLWKGGSDLELPVEGDRRAYVVHSGSLPRGELLAVRERWSLQARSGWVHFEDQRLPARGFQVEAAEKEWLASFLDRGPLEPGELAAFLDDPTSDDLGDFDYTARLLERTLRVPLDRRDELLTILADRAGDLDDRQLARLFPALRWLATSSDRRGLEEWRALLARRLLPTSAASER